MRDGRGSLPLELIGKDRAQPITYEAMWSGEKQARDLRSRPQHSTSPERAPAQHTPEPSPPGMFPHVGRRRPLGEGAFDTRRHGHALLLQGQSTLGTELNTAWASARGQLNTALQARRASAPSHSPPLSQPHRLPLASPAPVRLMGLACPPSV
jgi:hypothetical protein